jgi:hypothetical protein
MQGIPADRDAGLADPDGGGARHGAGHHLALTWAAAGIGPAELDVVRDHARKRLAYFAPAAAASPQIVSQTDLLPGGTTEQPVHDRLFVTIPLSLGHGPVFGMFQVEGAAAFDESDLLQSAGALTGAGGRSLPREVLPQTTRRPAITRTRTAMIARIRSTWMKPPIV